MSAETTVEVTISAVSFSVILDAPNSAPLFAAYAEECSVPDASPQRLIYEALEKAGSLRCFAAYADDSLIGFISVLVAVMPHHGHRLATTESFFVYPTYRDTGAGNLLLDAAEQYARESSCSALVYIARIGSRLDKVLARRAGCELTHVQHTRRLI